MISDHFSKAEVEHTDRDIHNEIPQDLAANAIRLAETVLEPLRIHLGPLSVSSWYRSPELNAAVGGEKTSYHLEALACDIVPNGSIVDKFKMAVALMDELPIDKIILEKRKSMWIHIQTNRDGATPRRLAMTATMGPDGRMKYAPYTT